MRVLLSILTIATVLNAAGVMYLVIRDAKPSELTPSRSNQAQQASERRIPVRSVIDHEGVTESALPFHEQPVDERISQATVIFTIRYEPKGDQMLGIVDRILKKSEGVHFHYDEGDRYASADFTLEAGVQRGDGMVNFCLGNPASMSSGSSIHHGRIPGLGGIKIEEFIGLVEGAK